MEQQTVLGQLEAILLIYKLARAGHYLDALREVAKLPFLPLDPLTPDVTTDVLQNLSPYVQACVPDLLKVARSCMDNVPDSDRSLLAPRAKLDKLSDTQCQPGSQLKFIIEAWQQPWVQPASHELTCPIAPAHRFKVLIVGLNSPIPKLLPQFIKSMELVQGDRGAGSIEQVNIAKGTHFKNVKHRIDELDKENFMCSYSIIEGDALGTTFEKITTSPEGGSVCKNTSKYFTIGKVDITEEKIKAGKEKVSEMFKAIEAYLLANPDAY
ncbi:major strawberry allergen Fra a 1.07-like [Eucalyptus grandis]|uniref:major strawberry allergen Fra a 1.07-like n=1 Tax=Eucalyptus grandis TaxID=71139 RepID=UPI00192EFFA0|nr:major strawberry allergen Fra a 1.07-like [Eucalyptus grandis]